MEALNELAQLIITIILVIVFWKPIVEIRKLILSYTNLVIAKNHHTTKLENTSREARSILELRQINDERQRANLEHLSMEEYQSQDN